MDKKHTLIILLLMAITIAGIIIFVDENEPTGGPNEEYVMYEDDGPDLRDNSGDPEKFDMTFEHVKPGEYSEVYINALHLTPGDTVTIELSGPGIVGSKHQEVTADDNGIAFATYRINQYGEYSSIIDTESGRRMKISLTVN